MRTIDKIEIFSRRKFLGRSGAAAALVASAPLLAQQSPPKPLKVAPASAVPTLVLMARDLFPHDRLGDEYYRDAVATIDDQLAAGEGKKNLLFDGVTRLDAASKRIFGHAYAGIDRELDRVAVLKTMETDDFFRTMRAGMVTALYNQQAVWTRLGYEGSSAEKGGYIHRGFNDIDWLPS